MFDKNVYKVDNSGMPVWLHQSDMDFRTYCLTLILITWRIWWANNARKWQMGFNSAFKGLTSWLDYFCRNLSPTCLCISLQLFSSYVSLKGTRRRHKSCAVSPKPHFKMCNHLSISFYCCFVGYFISAHMSNELSAMTYSTLSCPSHTRQSVGEWCDMA